MRFLVAVAALAAFGFALAAPIPKEKDKPKPKDEDAIQGTWQLDTLDAGGVAPPPVELQKIRFNFKDGGLEVTHDMMPRDKKGTYRLDPTAKPKTIDLVEGNGQTALGIYELDGDTFKICLAEGQNAARPTEFKPAGARVVVVTFKRMTEKDEPKKDK